MSVVWTRLGTDERPTASRSQARTLLETLRGSGFWRSPCNLIASHKVSFTQDHNKNGIGVIGMGRGRGFFAELQHQAAVAERNRKQAQAAAVRDQARAVAASERERKAQERAHTQLVKGDAAARKAARRPVSLSPT